MPSLLRMVRSLFGLIGHRYTILVLVSSLGLLVAGCDRAYPTIVRNGYSSPIVITAVLEDGSERTDEVPSMGEIYGQYGLIQIGPDSVGLFTSIIQGVEGEMGGKRVMKHVKEMTYKLATGKVLMTYPSDKGVIFRLNGGGLNFQPVYLISPNGVFAIPDDLQEGWRNCIPWIERVGWKFSPTAGVEAPSQSRISAEP